MADKDFVVKNGISVSNGNFIANASGMYHSGVVNAASVTAGSTVANSSGVYTAVVNGASLSIGSGATVANSTGIYTTTVNSASFTISTATVANASGVFFNSGAASINATNYSGTVNNANNLGGSAPGSYRLVSAGQVLEAGTVSTFHQTTAPTGWTKRTDQNDKTFRVVSGSVSQGGSIAFSTAFASRGISGSVNYHTLTTDQMPAHSHGVYDPGHSHTLAYEVPLRVDDTDRGGASSLFSVDNNVQPGTYGSGTGIGIYNAGGGGSHNHGLTMNNLDMSVAYIDLILAYAN